MSYCPAPRWKQTADFTTGNKVQSEPHFLTRCASVKGTCEAGQVQRQTPGDARAVARATSPATAAARPPVTSPEVGAVTPRRPSHSRRAPEAKRKWTCTRFRARAPFLAAAGSHELRSAGTMSYDYHQSWGRDGGPRSSGGGYGGGHGGSRGPGGGGGGGGGGRGGRGRHPGHLKGREIGLWYAKKQGQKNKEAERQEVTLRLGRAHGGTGPTLGPPPPPPLASGCFVVSAPAPRCRRGLPVRRLRGGSCTAGAAARTAASSIIGLRRIKAAKAPLALVGR